MVVWIEDEVLGYGGPIQAIARGGQHVLARIRRQPLCFRPPREGPDPSVDVGAFLGRHVERVPAAGLVGVRKIIDRELRTDREVTRVPGLGLRDQKSSRYDSGAYHTGDAQAMPCSSAVASVM